eukprot:g17030.t1
MPTNTTGAASTTLVEFGSSPSTDYGTIVAPVYVSPSVHFETLSSAKATATAPIKAGEIIAIEHGYCEQWDDVESGVWMCRNMMAVILGDPWLYNALQPRKEVALGSKGVRKDLWDREFLWQFLNDKNLAKHLQEKIDTSIDPTPKQTRSGERLALGVLLKLCRVPRAVLKADRANCYVEVLHLLGLQDHLEVAMRDAGHGAKWEALVRTGRVLESSLPGLVSDPYFGALFATEDIAKEEELFLCPLKNNADHLHVVEFQKAMQKADACLNTGPATKAAFTDFILHRVTDYALQKETAWIRTVLRNQFLARHGVRRVRQMHLGAEHHDRKLEQVGKARNAWFTFQVSRTWTDLPQRRYGDLCKEACAMSCTGASDDKTLQHLYGEVDQRASEDFGVADFVKSADVIPSSQELSALQTVEIAGLENAPELNGKLAMVWNIGDDFSTQPTPVPMDLNSAKLCVRICDLQKFVDGGSRNGFAFDYNHLPMKVLKRSKVTKSATRDARQMISKIIESRTGGSDFLTNRQLSSTTDYDMTRDPVDADNTQLDRFGCGADVAAELSHGLYQGVTAITPEEIATMFSCTESDEVTTTKMSAGTKDDDADGGTGGRGDEFSKPKFAVRQKFQVGERDFVLFRADLEDKRLQKTMLQMFVDNDFHPLNAFQALNHCLPPHFYETMKKLFGEKYAREHYTGAINARREGFEAPHPAAEALCIAEKQSEKIVAILYYHVEKGGIALDRPASSDEIAAATGRDSGSQNKKSWWEERTAAVVPGLWQHYFAADEIMEYPAHAGFCVPQISPLTSGSQVLAPRVLDYVDNFYLQYRLVDAAFRGLGLGTRLLRELQCAVVHHSHTTCARPAVLTTQVLQLIKYRDWYVEKLQFVPPKEYNIVQHVHNSVFNLIWIPEDVRKSTFRKNDQYRRCMARPIKCPLAYFDWACFQEIFVHAHLSRCSETGPDKDGLFQGTLGGFSGGQKRGVLDEAQLKGLDLLNMVMMAQQKDGRAWPGTGGGL